jgi:hypothetical protein
VRKGGELLRKEIGGNSSAALLNNVCERLPPYIYQLVQHSAQQQQLVDAEMKQTFHKDGTFHQGARATTIWFSR